MGIAYSDKYRMGGYLAGRCYEDLQGFLVSPESVTAVQDGFVTAQESSTLFAFVVAGAGAARPVYLIGGDDAILSAYTQGGDPGSVQSGYLASEMYQGSQLGTIPEVSDAGSQSGYLPSGMYQISRLGLVRGYSGIESIRGGHLQGLTRAERDAFLQGQSEAQSRRRGFLAGYVALDGPDMEMRAYLRGEVPSVEDTHDGFVTGVDSESIGGWTFGGVNPCLWYGDEGTPFGTGEVL